MIDEIFEMLMKEARSRKGQNLEVDMMMVLFEVTDKVCSALKCLQVEDIKTTRLKFRRRANDKEV